MHSITESTGEAQGSLMPSPQSVAQHIMRNSHEVGRTVILEFDEPAGVNIPIGATGQAWIAAETPFPFLGFLGMVIAFLLRFAAVRAYLTAL